jgi:Protein of unknown function (DUF1173)
MLEGLPGHGLTAPLAVLEVDGQRFEAASLGLGDAIAKAHAAHRRPRCMCRGGTDGRGIEMYVARLGDGFIVKRMPNTGCQHAPSCASYEPPAESSGLGQVLGSAIFEDPATGETTLKLDFPLTKIAGRAAQPNAGADGDSVATDGTKLSLRGLLHYLWDQAELTRWQPGFAGKRTWGTVRKHLLRAADNKIARGDPLRARLYIPEVFSVEQRKAIRARQTAQCSTAIAAPGKPLQLMLMIAEVKEIVPARYGFKAMVKHLPYQAFMLDEPLYRRLGRHFAKELALWGASEDLHMVMIATFNVAASGIPTIMELSLMPVTRYWLPVEDAFEKQLIERLVAEGRSFVKGLRYNLGTRTQLASATLTDFEGSGVLLFVDHADLVNGGASLQITYHPDPTWRWNPTGEPMPALPLQQSQCPKAAKPQVAD